MNDPQELEKECPETVNRNSVARWLRELGEWILQMAMVALVVMLVNTFLIRIVVVSGDSMYPTLQDGDIMLISVLDHAPEPGDIVVCESRGENEGRQIVKRCIATGGQAVFVDYHGNTVSVNGVVLEEPYVNAGEDDPLDGTGRENTLYPVPEGHIFVLGDNRNHSADSRLNTIGMIDVENVTGIMLLHIPLGQWFPQE